MESLELSALSLYQNIFSDIAKMGRVEKLRVTIPGQAPFVLFEME